MSMPLGEMLFRPEGNGVYRLPEGGAGALEAAARHLGHAFRDIDLGGCRDKAELLRRLARGLDFPSWFGHNWDALADCLGDLEWMDAPGYVLVLGHAADLQSAAEAEFLTLLDIFAEAAAYWQEQGIPFRVFVDAGPSPVLPDLK